MREAIEIVLISTLSRIVVLSLGVGSAIVVGPYDSSSYLMAPLTPPPVSTLDDLCLKYLRVLANWDGVYFWKISNDGYVYEQDHAFFPLLPSLMASSSALLQSYTSIGSWLSLKATTLLVGIAISNTAFVISCVVLLKLGRLVLGNTVEGRTLAYNAAVLLAWNPASIFMSAVYTESLSMMLTFSAMYAMSLSYSYHGNSGSNGLQMMLSYLLFAASGACRSNGMATALIFIVYDVIIRFIHYVHNSWLGRGRGGDQAGVVARVVHALVPFSNIVPVGGGGLAPLTGNIILASGGIAIAALPFIAFQIYAASMYCTESLSRPWCPPLSPEDQSRDISRRYSISTLPNLYSFVQSEYWKVGFLRYFEVKQIPNFMLASPMLTISYYCTAKYVASMVVVVWGRFHGGKKEKENHRREEGDIFNNVNLVPFVGHWIVLLLTGTFIAHVQVITRLICASSPALYWFTAKQLRQGEWWSSFITVYFAFFFTVGPILFCNFYPWT